MAVYDRWHLSHPPEGAQPCKCSRGKTKLYPNPATHEKGLRWQVRWDVIDEETGKRKQPRRNFAKKEGSDPETCADAFDAKIRTEINADSYIDPAAGQKPFKPYAEDIIANRAIDANTRATVESRFTNHVYPVIGETPLRALSKRPSLIQAVVAGMERSGLAASTIDGVMVNVSTIFNCAISDGLITKNPCKTQGVSLPTIDQRELAPLTAKQIHALREALPARYRAMVDAHAGLGMRQGEVFAFGPDDVEWLSPEPFVRIHHQIKVVKGGRIFDLPKYRKTRAVPLSPRRQVALAEHMRLHPPVTVVLPWRKIDGKPLRKRLFFSTKRSDPLRRSHFNDEVWKPALKAAGIPVTRENMSHAGRHYFASVLLTQGESIKAVSRWLGHANVTTTLEIYAHFMPESNTRMRGIIDDAFEVDMDAGAIRPATPNEP